MRLTIALAALLLFSPPRVRAQEAPRAGLTVRVSASGLPLEGRVYSIGLRVSSADLVPRRGE